MMIKSISLGLLIIFLFGCSASVKHYLQYDLALEEVKRPEEATQQFGEKKISTTMMEGYRYMFEDKMIRIYWFPSPSEFQFHLENKTNHSIKIIWNEAAFVCEKGRSHSVMHSGTTNVRRRDLQLPSIVEQNEAITDFVYPADYMSYSKDGWVERPLMGAGWTARPLLPSSQRGGDPQKFLKSAKSYIGKTMQVLLPIKAEDETYYYIFTFKVKDVHLAPK